MARTYPIMFRGCPKYEREIDIMKVCIHCEYFISKDLIQIPLGWCNHPEIKERRKNLKKKK